MNSNKNSGECEIYQAYDKCLDVICSNREKYPEFPDIISMIPRKDVN